ncbi:MAG TPA: helix-turn-helix domain-containing protein [Solirubrobacteraceae bacterium]|nr:helix-turn-helix domain-containing protein [Solirubrobacteraceae bacterium]
MSRLKAVCLLDIDPDLATEVDPQQLAHARHCSQAALFEIEGPTWDPGELGDSPGPDWLGLFVVDGLLVRTVTVGTRSACELLGPGDLFRPWDADDGYDPVPVSVSWSAPGTVRVALLDARFTQRVAAWPAILSRLSARFAARARALALSRAVSHLPRAEVRLLILFWLLAERWGTVGTEGIGMSLPLTHELIASLIGVRRPAVSLALAKLDRAGLLNRPSRGRWVLSHLALDQLEDPEALRLIEATAATLA